MKRKGIEVIITFKRPLAGSFKAAPRTLAKWEQNARRPGAQVDVPHYSVPRASHGS